MPEESLLISFIFLSIHSFGKYSIAYLTTFLLLYSSQAFAISREQNTMSNVEVRIDKPKAKIDINLETTVKVGNKTE